MNDDDLNDILRRFGEPDPGDFATISELCREIVRWRPQTKAVVLAQDLFDKYMAERYPDSTDAEREAVADLYIHHLDATDIQVLCDPALRPGESRSISWPDGLAPGPTP